MLYNTPHGKTTSPATPGEVPPRFGREQAKPEGDRLITWEPTDRNPVDVSKGISPSALGTIFENASGGDPRDQARLAKEIEEKDWDVGHNLGTRANAVLGLEWTVAPTDELEEDAQAKRIAEAAGAMLRAIPARATDGEQVDGFTDCLRMCMAGVLPGYQVAEILWSAGGREVLGFMPVPSEHILFSQSRQPLIAANNNGFMGAPLEPNRFLYHRHRARSGDATRGGLIRPLGWMFLLHAQSVRDLPRFIERYGMPFPVARLDGDAWNKDRAKIVRLVRNMGADGGGVFSKGVEIELMQAANGDGDVYFKMLDYLGDAKGKVILGQTASSGDAGGMSKGDAQSQVRQDILEADCKMVAATIREQLLRPWVLWNFGPNAPVPELRFAFEKAEDLKALSEVIVNLNTAGHRVRTDHVAKRFGLELEVTPSPAANPLPDNLPASGLPAAGRLSPGRAATAQVAAAAVKRLVREPGQAALRRWLGPVAEAIAEAQAGNPTPEEFAARMRRLGNSLPQLAASMDTRGLEAQIAQALFAADANGRLEAAGRVAKEFDRGFRGVRG